MKNKLSCPECKSTDTKRLIFEWSFKELIVVIIFIVLLGDRFAISFLAGKNTTDWAMYQIVIVFGMIAFIVFPILLNLRFPRYK